MASSHRNSNNQRSKKDKKKNGDSSNISNSKRVSGKKHKVIRDKLELFNDIKQYYPNDAGSMFAILPGESNVYYCQHYTTKTGYCKFTYTFDPDNYIERNSRNEPLEEHLKIRHDLSDLKDTELLHHLDSGQESAFEYQITHFKIWSKITPVTFGLILLYFFDISYRIGIMYGVFYALLISSFIFYFLLSVELLTFFVSILTIWLMYYYPSQLRIVLILVWAMFWLLRDIFQLIKILLMFICHITR